MDTSRYTVSAFRPELTRFINYLTPMCIGRHAQEHMLKHNNVPRVVCHPIYCLTLFQNAKECYVRFRFMRILREQKSFLNRRHSQIYSQHDQHILTGMPNPNPTGKNNSIEKNSVKTIRQHASLTRIPKGTSTNGNVEECPVEYRSKRKYSSCKLIQ